MKEWSYGEDKLGNRNPVYYTPIHLENGDSKEFEFEDCKIIQVSYITDSQHIVLAVKLDGRVFTINNSYCLEDVADTRGIGYIQQEEVENLKTSKREWRVTCLIPIIFKGKGSIILNQEGGPANIRGLHIYYLI